MFKKILNIMFTYDILKSNFNSKSFSTPITH